MDDYTYATLGADGWFRCDRLHHPSFPTLCWDMLHRFGYTGTPTYRGCLYHQFGRGRCKFHVDSPTHPFNPSMMAWLTTARGDDLDDTLERTAQQALTEFCEHHLPSLDGTVTPTLANNKIWSN
jgi:hypothetical protein